MTRYYTRACNFYYGKNSKNKIKLKKALPLNNRADISFDHIEIISRKKVKKITISQINKLPKKIKLKVKKDLLTITRKIKNFENLDFNKTHLMGVLNITPDSFSDGGKYISAAKANKQMLKLFKNGASIVDIGGESTRPGSKAISEKLEWSRIKKVLKMIKKNKLISIDTRKSAIMKKSLSLGAKIINDVSGLNYDQETINVLRKSNAPFVLQHSLGDPEVMQSNPKYKNVILDIYDFFEQKIEYLRKSGIKHNKIILDPGIGFGKNLNHNLKILKNISIYHSLGFPILLGISRKRFIKEISKENDSHNRLGGTISSGLFALKQGVQILRVHDVNEMRQSLKVYQELIR
jgi:dihydropteroate synthase